MQQNNSHKEHRKRLKNKIKTFGTDVLAPHEVFEALLTYSIPRKDTNPIGHELLEHFGDFHKVIDADFYDLQKVKGIGPESATFINIISAVVDLYNKSKGTEKIAYLKNTQDCVQYFREHYRIKNNEFMVMVCLNKKQKVIKSFTFKGHSEEEITFELNQIINKITDLGIYGVVMFHTHPSGTVQPSDPDISATQRIINVCLLNGIDFKDHIILNEAEHYSFHKHGMVEIMKQKYLDFASANGIILHNNIKAKKD